VLVLRNVQTGYGNILALKGISLRLDSGKIITLLGANGAGKTTMLKTIMGILHPFSGSIEFEEKEIHRFSPQKVVSMGLSLVPEGRRIFPHLTLYENLKIGAYIRWNKAEITEGFQEVTGYFPVLAERGKQLGGTLSGGEQQMLAIARGLMSRPRLLLLDEPSMGLAPAVAGMVFDIIQKINRKGTTVFLVEQNAQMALSIAQEGFVLETGSIVLEDNTRNLLGNEMVRKAYLGE